MKKLFVLGAASLGLLALSAASQAQIVYDDTFAGTGDLVGASPTVGPAGVTWASAEGSGIYQENSGDLQVSTSGNAYTAAYLPVNGSSGVTLDGSEDFTLSCVVNTPQNGYGGIGLYTGAPGSLFSPGIGVLGDSSFVTYTVPGSPGNINYYFADGVGADGTISLVYSAEAGTLSYEVNGAIVNGYSGPLVYSVTPAQIQSITDIGIGDQGSVSTDVPPVTYSNFQLSVTQAVPEPATIWSAALGLIGLVGFQMRRSRKS